MHKFHQIERSLRMRRESIGFTVQRQTDHQTTLWQRLEILKSTKNIFTGPKIIILKGVEKMSGPDKISYFESLGQCYKCHLLACFVSAQ